jgi:hypothetical protein
MTIEVTGRNGFKYDAKPLTGCFFVVGKFIVTVFDGQCCDTVCKATKKNIQRYSKT